MPFSKVGEEERLRLRVHSLGVLVSVLRSAAEPQTAGEMQRLRWFGTPVLVQPVGEEEIQGASMPIEGQAHHGTEVDREAFSNHLKSDSLPWATRSHHLGGVVKEPQPVVEARLKAMRWTWKR